MSDSRPTKKIKSEAASSSSGASSQGKDDDEMMMRSPGSGGPSKGESSSSSSGKGKARATRQTAVNDDDEDSNSGGGAAAEMVKPTTQVNTNRREAMKRVAESRAAHFARADSSDRVRIRPVRSTTPLPGAHRPTPGNGDEPEQWPGPFSTARQLVRQREAAAAARQERLSGQVVTEEEMEGLKTVEVTWTPKKTKRKLEEIQVPSLGQLCLDMLLKYVDDVESLGYVTSQVRYQFAECLAKVGKLTADTVERILEPGLQELYLPDCKLLEEAGILAAVEKVARAEEDFLDPTISPPSSPSSPSLKILRLGWCGRGFGRRTVEALIQLGLCPNLEVLELGGLYRLQDKDFTSLLSHCKGLTCLEMPYKSAFSVACAKAVTSPGLSITSLSLAHCSQVEPEALQALCELKGMKKLDLSGLKLTDSLLLKILEANGSILTSLIVNECEQLTNESMIAIGEHCRSLVCLGLDQLYGVTPEALTALFSQFKGLSGMGHVSLNRTYANDDTVVAVAVACGASLRKIGLHSLNDMTDVALCALAQFCSSSLEEIQLSFCRKITENGLGHLVDSSPRIKTLHLWGNTQITERFFLGHSATSLKIFK